MNKLLLIIFSLFLITGVSAASYWVDDVTSCPSADAINYPGQNAFPDIICGDSSGTAVALVNVSISAPTSTATSNTDYTPSFNGGYVINCYATADGSAPQCDNIGAFWCDRNSTCYTTQHRDTTCTANVFAESSCGNCRSGFNNCDTDNINCEVQNGASCGSGTGVYSSCLSIGSGGAGNCISSARLDCNNDDSDGDTGTCNAGDGCEILIGGSCSVGSLTGTYSSSCTGSVGTCVVDKSYFETGTLVEYLTDASQGAMLWFKNFAPNGWLINVSNSNDEVWGVNNESCMVLKDGTVVCGAGDLGSGDNESWNQTFADTLYSGSEWAYNQTTPANEYTDATNSSMTSWIESTFIKVVEFFTKSQIVSMIFGNLTEAKEYTNTVISGNDSAWSSTYNSTYDSITGDNSSWNETYADGKYAYIIWNYNQTTATYNLYNDAWSSTYNSTYNSLETNNNSWNETYSSTLYSSYLWGYNQTLGVDQTYVEGLGFVTGAHTADTNESDRFNNLTSVNCAGNDKMIGVYPNGTIECSAVAGGGDFSFVDFQASFNSNWTALDYDKWMYNQTYSGSTYNATYDALQTNNNSWNQTFADTLYISQSEEGDLNVNSSSWWSGITSFNVTQFSNVVNSLTLSTSWLTNWINAWLATITTDDVSEGSVNLYDNQSWNETLADTLYVAKEGDSTINGNLTATGFFSTFIGKITSRISSLFVDDANIISANITNLNTTGNIYLNDDSVITREDSDSAIGITSTNTIVIKMG